MAGWLVPRGDLTLEQLRAVEMPVDRHRVLSGGPGSGKTLVLLHRARHLADALRVADGRFLVLVYTNALTAYLRSAAADLGLPAAAVRTYDDWCAEHWETRVSPRRPCRPDGVPDFAAIRRGVAAEVRANPGRPPLYDFVLVDEGQDLEASVFDVLSRVSAHLTVALDPRQRIYDEGAREEEILAALGVPSRSVALLETWRCSPHVSRLAARLLRGDEEREAFLRQARAAAVEREAPLLYLARDADDEVARAAEVARARLLRGERVAVLLPSRRLVHRFAWAFAARGIPVEVPLRHGESAGGFPGLDFASDLVKVLPFHSAKGLTFDSVLLPRLLANDVPARSEAALRRLLFVGITRATSWVYLGAQAGPGPALLADAGLFSPGPDLVVQTWETHAPGHPPGTGEDDDDPVPPPVLDPSDDLASWL